VVRHIAEHILEPILAANAADDSDVDAAGFDLWFALSEDAAREWSHEEAAAHNHGYSSQRLSPSSLLIREFLRLAIPAAPTVPAKWSEARSAERDQKFLAGRVGSTTVSPDASLVQDAI